MGPSNQPPHAPTARRLEKQPAAQWPGGAHHILHTTWFGGGWRKQKTPPLAHWCPLLLLKKRSATVVVFGMASACTTRSAPPGAAAAATPSRSWFYRDASGEVQGPFDGAVMRVWFSQGFLPATLPVLNAVTATDGTFVPLGELFRGESPFVASLPAAPLRAPVTGDCAATDDCEQLLRELEGMSLTGTVVAAPPAPGGRAAQAAELLVGRAEQSQKRWSSFRAEQSQSRKPVSFALAAKSRGRRRGSTPSMAAPSAAAQGRAQQSSCTAAQAPQLPPQYLVVDTNELLNVGAALPSGANQGRQDTDLRVALLQSSHGASGGGKLGAAIPSPLVVLPLRALRELDGLKRDHGERGVAARRVVDALGRAMASPRPAGAAGAAWLIGQRPHMRPAARSAETPDEEIVECAEYFDALASGTVTLVTSDKHMILLARAKGLQAKSLQQVRSLWLEKNGVWRSAYAATLAQNAVDAASAASGQQAHNAGHTTAAAVIGDVE